MPNQYPILKKTDTDTDVGIGNTEKYRIPTIRYQKVSSVRYVISPIGSMNLWKKEQRQTEETK